jgi:hypothetical protein
MKTDCPLCAEFITWLHQRAATDVKAAQLLARLHDADAAVFCDANAHWDRALFRDFMAALSQREGA